MAHLLIIGGSGFFGKSILDSYKRKLLDSFHITKITILAKNANKLLIDAPHLLDNSISLLNEDITKSSSLPFADIVIHAAASSDERNYIIRPHEERVNIQSGTSNFCKLALHFYKKSQIIYISSGATYGQQPKGMEKMKEEFAFGSIDQLAPQKQDYAAAKRDSEQAIIRLGRQGLHVSIARCFSFVGPYLPLNQHFAIGNFIRDGMQGNLINVNAKSTVYRSYLYADDLVQWLMRIAQSASTTCPIFNVGSDEAISIHDLAKKIAFYFKVDLQLPQIESTLVDRYIPSIEKARKLGCQIEYPLDKAIELTASSLLGSQEFQ